MNKFVVAKKILFWFVLVFVGFVATGILFSYIYKDEIIGYFIKETNKHITTPIDVGKIEVSFLSNFPTISINLHNVIIKESNGEHIGILGRADYMSISFNPILLYNHDYTISRILISDAEVNLKIDKEGLPNYLFFKQDSLKQNDGKLSLQNIKVERVKVDYEDVRSNYHVALFVSESKSSLAQLGDMLKINATGSVVSDEIKVGNRVFFNNKNIEIKTELDYNLHDKVYDFKTGNLLIDKGEFEVTGNVKVEEKTIDLDITGINTSFQSINSLLSNDLSQYFNDYRSKGAAYFSGKVSGSYDGQNNPQVSIDFGAKDASFYHPKYKKQIKEVNFTGHFDTGKRNIRASYRLDLKDFSCRLEDKMLEGSLMLQNFDDYTIDLSLKGEADVNSLLLLFPEKYVKSAFGNLKMDIHVNGKLNNPKLSREFQANGSVDFENISFVLTGEKLPFNRINGSLALRNNDLAISDFTGYVGNSDFKINGFINDISKVLLAKEKVYQLQADFKSEHLDFDELLKSNFASRDTTIRKDAKYEFTISPNISLDLNCDIKELKIKRFVGRSIFGHINIKNEIAQLKNISFSSMGGRVKADGTVNSKNKNIIEIWTDGNLFNINIDSVFYVFKNFNQDWLMDKNLKGQLDADVNLYFTMNKNLVLNNHSLVATLNTSISNGELNNFEPIMQLSKFVEEESLTNMRFSQMTNQIRIENETIYLPEMEIKSNVSNILVRGTHSFDKKIDYHLSVPLKSFIRISKKKNYTQDARKGMNLLLKITGTTSDYSISFDGQAIKDKFTGDFKDEGKEWKKILKNEPIAPRPAPELEDEYFEFDENGSSQ